MTDYTPPDNKRSDRTTRQDLLAEAKRRGGKEQRRIEALVSIRQTHLSYYQ